MAEPFDPSALYSAVDLGGVLANGVLGGVLARQLKFDPVGFVVLAVLSGLGGGVLRDTLLQNGPPVALTNLAYLSTALVGALIAFTVDLRGKYARRGLLVADALALGAWSATGTSKALSLGLPWLSAIFLGIVTAVGGGMIRDVVVREVPKVFYPGTLYATVALLASVVMAVAFSVGAPTLGMGGSIVVAAVVALASRRWGWSLPDPTDLRVRMPLPRLPWSSRTPDVGPDVGVDPAADRPVS
jgi:uncharacterized membrane protein YeiH